MADAQRQLLIEHYRRSTEILLQHLAQTLAGCDAGDSLHKEPGKCASQYEGQLRMDVAALASVELLCRLAQAVLGFHEQILSGHCRQRSLDDELFSKRLRDISNVASSKFYSRQHDQVPQYWFEVFNATTVLKTHHQLLAMIAEGKPLTGDCMDKMVYDLDYALIVAGGPRQSLGEGWTETTLQLLETAWNPGRRHMSEEVWRAEDAFSSFEPRGRSEIPPNRLCPRIDGDAAAQFLRYVDDVSEDLRPLIFTGLIEDWPAMTDHPWRSPSYLLSKTFGGRRLVPVEIGRSYVDDGWGQKLMHFRDFLDKHVNQGSSSHTGYLAQHDLFRQIPSLRNDILTPDMCWTEMPPHPTDASKNKPKVDAPQVNAWFGPANTNTPLHTDAYHNLFCQVVGTKYVRLYPPSATGVMRPREAENGIDMSNTSRIDVGVLEGWDADRDGICGREVEQQREDLRDVECWECILEPGDTLFIPMGWWHHVRSLSVSFSVSFWWN